MSRPFRHLSGHKPSTITGHGQALRRGKSRSGSRPSPSGTATKKGAA